MKYLKSSTNCIIWVIALFLFNSNVQGQGVFEYTVTPVNNLDFGTFSVGPSQGGTITIDLSNNPTETGSIIMAPFGSQPLTGAFQIQATKGKTTVILSSPNSPSELLGSKGGKLFVDNLTFNPNSIYVDKFSSPTIKMGGRLSIPAGSPTGDYSGTINVIFTYQ